jgi:hypothetical protein
MINSESRERSLVDKIAKQLSLHLDRVLHEQVDLVYSLLNKPAEYGVEWHTLIG